MPRLLLVRELGGLEGVSGGVVKETRQLNKFPWCLWSGEPEDGQFLAANSTDRGQSGS